MCSRTNYDVITIRMSRSDLRIPWGFEIQAPCTILNVESGSLADKAGLRNGDFVDELQFEENASLERLQELIKSAHNELNIIVLREPKTTMAARIWKQDINYGNKSPADSHTRRLLPQFEHGPKVQNNLHTSLQHLQQEQPLTTVHGFNQTSRQFASTKSSKPDYNTPAYMHSEALRMIQESEKGADAEAVPPKINAPPECFCCNRIIIGLMCNAFKKNLHPDCFQCSTCGTSLTQQGYHFINNKFYCDVHGKQRNVQPLAPAPKTAAAGMTVQPSLKNPSRPFNAVTNTYQNPKNVVQPTNRFGQILVNNNTQHSADPTGNFTAFFNHKKADQLKSPAFQLRRKIQKQWPPTDSNATHRNAQALRFWKHEFGGDSGDTKKRRVKLNEALTSKLNNLIADFDSGRIAKLNAKVAQTTPRSYCKRVVETPERLNKPMRPNSFAWSNAELPSETTTQSASMSSSIILCANIDGGSDKAAKNISSNSTTVQLDKPPTFTDFNSENSSKGMSNVNEEQANSSWKFLPQIIEEQDILTESTISSLKSSTSFESIKKSTSNSSSILVTEPKVPTRTMSSVQMATSQLQLVCNTNESARRSGSCVDKTKIERGVKVQQSTMKQESFCRTFPSECTESKEQHKLLTINDQKMQSSLDEFVEIEREILGQLKHIDLEEKKPTNVDVQAENRRPGASCQCQQEKKYSVTNQELVSSRAKTYVDPVVEAGDDQKAALESATTKDATWPQSSTAPQMNSNNLTELLVTSHHQQLLVADANHGLAKQFDDIELPSFIDFVPVADKNRQQRLDVNQALMDSVTTQKFHSTKNLLPNLIPIANLPPPQSEHSVKMKQLDPNNLMLQESLYHGLATTLLPKYSQKSTQISSYHHRPDLSLQLQCASPSLAHSKYYQQAQLSSRENSTELSSLADLPPQMPELMTFTDDPNRNSSNLSNLNKSLEDCFERTGMFLSFLSGLDLLRTSQVQPQNQRIPDLSSQMDTESDFLASTNNNFYQQNQQTCQERPLADFGQRQHGQLYQTGGQVPRCEYCAKEISGSFVLATGKTWCPEHFTCANQACNRRLLDCGFVEEAGKKYCEKCFETLIAPSCAKCSLPITADCLNALQKQWHPECFVCAHCRQTFDNTAFYLENEQPYCEKDWTDLFTTKCVACKFPIEAGDRWIEAIGSSFHSNCFNCFSCQVNLEGQNFYARDGHPFCRAHA